MSEHITHIAVYDDTVRLLNYSDRITAAFKESTTKEFDSGWIACGTNGNHLWAVPLLEEYREKYKAGDRSRDTLRKIAAAIGWITHRAADLVQKPLEAILDAEQNPNFNGQEQSAYFDTIAFREVFKGGKYSPTPFQPMSRAVLEKDMKSHPAAAAFDVEGLEIAFSHFYLGEALNNHEFVSKQDNFEKWFDQFMANKQKFSEDLDMYISGFNQPEKAKTAKYIETIKYFNASDTIMRLLQSIREGKPDRSISIDVAVAATACQSQYSKMVANSFTMISFASDYFEGKIDKSSLYEVINMDQQFRK